jgi:DNA (cytosine-5)-methyltransferase 1
MRTIDLFAGVGGIRTGMELAGFTTVFSNDFDEKCKETFDLNFSEPSMTLSDFNSLEFESIPEFDILTGGFPCQPFSVAGKREGFKDMRGNHFFTIASLIYNRRPRAFLLENVKGLLTHDGGNTFKTIFDTLHELEYRVHYAVLNSKIHANVPQNRERLFIVGFRDIKAYSNFKFPEPITLTQTIFDLLEDKVSDKYNVKPKIFDKLSEFGIKEDTITSHVYQWRYNYIREHKHPGVSPCLVTVGLSPIIKIGNVIRHLTPKECFNLQGFPRDYKLPEIHDRHLYKQAGNSVTVPLIQRIADGI